MQVRSVVEEDCIQIPCDSPQLKLRLREHPLVSAVVPLATYATPSKTLVSYRRPVRWVEPCFHPPDKPEAGDYTRAPSDRSSNRTALSRPRTLKSWPRFPLYGSHCSISCTLRSGATRLRAYPTPITSIQVTLYPTAMSVWMRMKTNPVT